MMNNDHFNISKIQKNTDVYKFEKKVLSTLQEYKMINGKSRILTAVSGGADSVSLLLSLNSLSVKLGFSVFVCHLNHGIRAQTAERDEKFTKKLAEKLSLPFYSEKVNIPELYKNTHISLEAAARNERYAFFERAAYYFNADKIATAHTMSDNAETVIFNICRGSGTEGLCGIPPVRDNFIRPLIKMSRIEVENYLAALSQDFVIDETNYDEEYSRNFLRHSVIPKLKTLNPSLEDALFRLSESSRKDREYFDSLLSVFSEKECHTLNDIMDLPQAVRLRYIKNLCKNYSVKEIMTGGSHINALANAAEKTFSDMKTRYISLPDNLCAKIDFKNGISIYKTNSENNDIQGCSNSNVSFNIALHIGENIINSAYAVFLSDKNSNIDICLPDIIKKEDNVYKLYKKVDLFSDIINRKLFARQRFPGDSIRIGGMSRKLKKVFSENAVPAIERQLVPVICDSEEQIICVPFFSAPCDSEKSLADNPKATVAFYRSQYI